MSRHKIILDCDPGHDDAIAILLAAGDPSIELLAITTCAGNQTLEKVTRNALAVCAVAGLDVPVAAGAAGPLVRQQLVAPDIHGESGLDGPVLPAPTHAADPRHAVDLIIDTIMAHEPGTVSLVPTGPLTNIALAMRKEPSIIGRVKEVVLMGGSYTRGNRTPAAEFNIAADPEAAAAVFDAEWPVTMVGLDLTHQATADDDVVARIAAIGSPLADFVVEVLTFFASTYRERQGFDAPPVHDPCCVAAIIDPSVMEIRSAFVAVELAGTWTSGMTVTDFGDAYGQPHNARVATKLDRARFWDLTIEAIRRLSEASATEASATTEGTPQ
ncbi:nucleoside hydrolase [Sinomonas sp. ASV322]|uniref:uridine-preferring nucleoside hydrolase UriH n=1 Tax=Sinomonas sp. ASV322 TaxID=3041920 RepID=UPI0027DADED1|nr:nucleoside hydrolase [Sinomonas sp. ASV322]MDQ4504400.1 nucleoside hydrolase [Sinomonas sp. ASV322]